MRNCCRAAHGCRGFCYLGYYPSTLTLLALWRVYPHTGNAIVRPGVRLPLPEPSGCLAVLLHGQPCTLLNITMHPGIGQIGRPQFKPPRYAAFDECSCSVERRKAAAHEQYLSIGRVEPYRISNPRTRHASHLGENPRHRSHVCLRFSDDYSLHAGKQRRCNHDLSEPTQASRSSSPPLPASPQLRQCRSDRGDLVCKCPL